MKPGSGYHRSRSILDNAFQNQDNQDNVESFLCASSLFGPGRAGGNSCTQADTPELRQASAKLHCLYGVPIDKILPRIPYSILRHDSGLAEEQPSFCTRSRMAGATTHIFARSKVYDLREYTDHTLWGPFMNDGSQRVDWEKVEAVMVVLGFNLRKFTDRSDSAHIGKVAALYFTCDCTLIPDGVRS